MPDPITPTRIIPAGTPLPLPETAPATPPPPPPPPTPPAPPLPPQWGGPWPWGGLPPQPPGPVEMYVRVELVQQEDDEPELTWRQQLVAVALRWARPVLTWRGAIALVLAVIPITAEGDSAATIWHATVSDARDFGLFAGYVVAAAPLTLSGWLLARVGPTAPRLWLLAVSLVGTTAAITPYDIVQILTGVIR